MIASQTESLPHELRGPDLSPGLWRGKKGKKDGLGLFSKLLSGLLKNPGNGPSLSGAIPEEAAEGGEPGGGHGLKPGKTGRILGRTPGRTPGIPGEGPGGILGDAPGETPDGKTLRKTGGQKAFKAGPDFLNLQKEGAAGAESPGGTKKPAGSRKGEEAGETLYLLSRAEISAGKSRLPKDPEGESSPVPGWEGAEPGLSESPEVSALFHRGQDFPNAGPEFPAAGEVAARENRRPQAAAEGLSGLEGKLAGEFSRSRETRPDPSGPGKTEKDEKRPAEARKTERRREKPGVFEARDLRSGQEAGALSLKEENALEGKQFPAQEIDLSVELKGESRGGERAPQGGEKTLSQAFEDILGRELHQNLNGDIVRHASVLLRDGGEGLIRLSLKPDTLGNVKIRLEMAENKITGHIVVESGEALRAFEREIGALEQAFKDSGFDSADLSMSLASGNEGGRRQGEETPFFSDRFAAEQAASRYDASTEKTDRLFAIGSANGLKPGNGRISVNLLI